MYKKILHNFLVAGVVNAMALSCVWAETTLAIGTWGSPTHGINTVVWPTWGEWIEEATEGRVKLEIIYELAPPNSMMDIVADGIADVSWLFHGYYTGRFDAAELVEIPYFVDTNSEEMSKAYWRVYDKHLKKANEHRGIVVLGLGVHGPGTLYTTKVVNSWQDIIDARIRIGGGVAAKVAKRLGVSGVSLPASAAYEAGAQGIIDGIMITIESLKTFRLAEVFPYIYTVPGGLYRGSFSIIVNQEQWDSISKADQEAILAVSGERLSGLFGAMMDEYDQYGIDFAEENGNTFIAADETALNEIRELTADLSSQWVEDNKNKGFDAQAALDMFQADIGVNQ